MQLPALAVAATYDCYKTTYASRFLATEPSYNRTICVAIVAVTDGVLMSSLHVSCATAAVLAVMGGVGITSLL